MKKLLALTAFASAALVATSASALTLDTPHGKQEVPDNIQRIVVVDGASADTILTLGKLDKVVGVVDTKLMPTFLQTGYKNVNNIGSFKTLDYERIAELKPDLIIISIRNFNQYDQFKKIAPTLKADINYADAYGSIKQNAYNIAKIVGADKAVVDAEFAKLDATIAATKAKVAGKSALTTLISDRKISVYGDKGRYGIVYQAFGFKADPNIKDGRHGMEAGYEYIATQNPDYMFVVDRTAAISDKKGNAQEVLNNDLVKGTNAYKHNAIGYLDPKVWYLAFGGLTTTKTIVNDIADTVNKAK